MLKVENDSSYAFFKGLFELFTMLRQLLANTFTMGLNGKERKLKNTKTKKQKN